MNFTEYLPDANQLATETAKMSESLRTNRGDGVNLLPFALSVINQRLQKDPMRYLDYGPFWWALKIALGRGGYDYGADGDMEIAAAYRGSNDAETVVAAEGFSELYLSTQFVGTREHQINDSGEWWTLYDEDMELYHTKRQG